VPPFLFVRASPVSEALKPPGRPLLPNGLQELVGDPLVRFVSLPLKTPLQRTRRKPLSDLRRNLAGAFPRGLGPAWPGIPAPKPPTRPPRSPRRSFQCSAPRPPQRDQEDRGGPKRPQGL
jgi:hypothetical protein